MPKNVSDAIISQTWFRVVNLIEEPVKYLRYVSSILTGSLLTSAETSSQSHHQKSPANKQVGEDTLSQVSSGNDSNHPQYHPAYVTHWHYSFYRIMRGIHCVVSALLGG